MNPNSCIICSFKYPLSIVSQALDVLGPQLLIGYDIGCKLAQTISSSSLATKFAENEFRMCVDAFHGYTHNYACQDINHPNIIEGIGLEDLAMMERIFSHSNQLAPIICYASAYNRRMFIDMLFRQWDEDKYLNLSNMLYGNYKQALRIIQEDGFALQEAKHSLGIDDGDIKAWRAEQSEYLRTCTQEPEYDIHAVAYVEMLQKLRDARCVPYCITALNTINRVYCQNRFREYVISVPECNTIRLSIFYCQYIIHKRPIPHTQTRDTETFCNGAIRSDLA